MVGFGVSDLWSLVDLVTKEAGEPVAISFRKHERSEHLQIRITTVSDNRERLSREDVIQIGLSHSFYPGLVAEILTDMGRSIRGARIAQTQERKHDA